MASQVISNTRHVLQFHGVFSRQASVRYGSTEREELDSDGMLGVTCTSCDADPCSQGRMSLFREQSPSLQAPCCVMGFCTCNRNTHIDHGFLCMARGRLPYRTAALSAFVLCWAEKPYTQQEETQYCTVQIALMDGARGDDAGATPKMAISRHVYHTE